MTFVLITVMLAVLAVSCTTTKSTKEDDAAYDTVQVIDVKEWTKPTSSIPLTAVIEPEDLVTSPIIDITTLKATDNARQSAVKSSTLEQETRKAEIQEAVKTNPMADTTLDDTQYGAGTSSGALASEAAGNAFTYITSSNAFTGAIAVYDWIEGNIYEIVTSPKAITDFRLKPGESITAAPIVNDGGSSWQFTMGTSVENGTTVQHLFIKPTTVGLDTSMIVLTDQRTYYFRVASFETSYMTALKFSYPVDSGKGYYVDEDFEDYIVDPSVVSDSAFSLDLTKVDYGYKIKQYKGKPAWTPQNVFSDTTKTYIQLPVSVATSDELPSVYIIRGGEEALVNYRIIGNLYQLDTVITKNQTILLKSGEKEQVKITRTN